MIPPAAALVLAMVLIVTSAFGGPATPVGEEPETPRNNALRVVYFPFLVVGHGLLFIAKYGVAYPVYYATQPVVDFFYESSEDPAEYEQSAESP